MLGNGLPNGTSFSFPEISTYPMKVKSYECYAFSRASKLTGHSLLCLTHLRAFTVPQQPPLNWRKGLGVYQTRQRVTNINTSTGRLYEVENYLFQPGISTDINQGFLSIKPTVNSVLLIFSPRLR